MCRQRNPFSPENYVLRWSEPSLHCPPTFSVHNTSHRLIQLTLEQHRFELRRFESTYTRIFFSKHTPPDGWLAESSDAEPRGPRRAD